VKNPSCFYSCFDCTEGCGIDAAPSQTLKLCFGLTKNGKYFQSREEKECRDEVDLKKRIEVPAEDGGSSGLADSVATILEQIETLQSDFIAVSDSVEALCEVLDNVNNRRDN